MVIEAVDGSLGAKGGGELAMGEGEGEGEGEEVVVVEWRRALALWERRALTRLVMGAIWERRRDSSDVRM